MRPAAGREESGARTRWDYDPELMGSIRDATSEGGRGEEVEKSRSWRRGQPEQRPPSGSPLGLPKELGALKDVSEGGKEQVTR